MDGLVSKVMLILITVILIITIFVQGIGANKSMGQQLYDVKDNVNAKLKDGFGLP